MVRYIVILIAVAAFAVLGPRYAERFMAGDEAVEAPAVQAAQPRRVTLKAGPGGQFVTEARINNRSIDVLVDTGATLVALTDDDARRVGVRPRQADYTVKVNTANGIAHAARVQLNDVRIGGIRVRDVSALVLQPGKLHVTLLGMAFLGELRTVSLKGDQLLLVQ